MCETVLAVACTVILVITVTCFMNTSFSFLLMKYPTWSNHSTHLMCSVVTRFHRQQPFYPCSAISGIPFDQSHDLHPRFLILVGWFYNVLAVIINKVHGLGIWFAQLEQMYVCDAHIQADISMFAMKLD